MAANPILEKWRSGEPTLGGWMVTDDGLWFTEESGRSWKRIADQLKPNKKLKPSPPGGLVIARRLSPSFVSLLEIE